VTHRNGPIGNRAKLQVRAAKLRAEGRLYREIAHELNISLPYASALITDPDDSKTRARKLRYAQPCVDCGAPTSGAEGLKKEPRCTQCGPAHAGKLKKVWTRELLLSRIQEWAEIHGEPPAVGDWNPTQARTVYHDEARAARWEQSEGHWPWFTLVVREFGTWNHGLEAAGFTSRQANGGAGNQRRNRKYGINRHKRQKGQNIMEALVLKLNGDGSWHELGKTDARSYQDAVEALATEPGTYLASLVVNVFEVAPVQKLAATVNTR
jgi:hypothetical protein